MKNQSKLQNKVENMEKQVTRYKIIDAIVSDNSTRYAGTSMPQNTGRFNIPKKCYSVLSPKFGESFYVIQDNSKASIIITKDPKEKDEDKIIDKITFGSGIKAQKNRLRINQNIAKMFGACDVGISIFDYNNKLALRVGPKVPKPDFDIYRAKAVEDLAKYVLWPGRTIKFLSFATDDSVYSGEDFDFKLLGSAFYLEKHNAFLQNEEHMCTLDDECYYCQDKKQYPIFYRAIYFPILYNVLSKPSRPGIIKFVNSAINLSSLLIEEANRYFSKTKSGYWSGDIKYDDSKVWKFGKDDKGIVNISKMKSKEDFTAAENGWLLTMRKEFKKFIAQKEEIPASLIVNKKLF